MALQYPEQAYEQYTQYIAKLDTQVSEIRKWVDELCIRINCYQMEITERVDELVGDVQVQGVNNK